MAAEEAALVLGHKGARAGAEDGDLALYLLDVIVARLEVDLGPCQSSILGHWLKTRAAHMFYGDGLSRGLLNALVDDAEAPT